MIHVINQYLLWIIGEKGDPGWVHLWQMAVQDIETVVTHFRLDWNEKYDKFGLVFPSLNFCFDLTILSLKFISYLLWNQNKHCDLTEEYQTCRFLHTMKSKQTLQFDGKNQSCKKIKIFRVKKSFVCLALKHRVTKKGRKICLATKNVKYWIHLGSLTYGVPICHRRQGRPCMSILHRHFLLLSDFPILLQPPFSFPCLVTFPFEFLLGGLLFLLPVPRPGTPQAVDGDQQGQPKGKSPKKSGKALLKSLTQGY